MRCGGLFGVGCGKGVQCQPEVLLLLAVFFVGGICFIHTASLPFCIKGRPPGHALCTKRRQSHETRKTQRLGRTVQFSDTGLYPAQADHTRHLTRDTRGVPVVAAGIPTLMQAQEGADLVVTPRALDSVIAHGAALLAGSVNRALQPRLTVQQLCWLTG